MMGDIIVFGDSLGYSCVYIGRDSFVLIDARCYEQATQGCYRSLC